MTVAAGAQRHDQRRAGPAPRSRRSCSGSAAMASMTASGISRRSSGSPLRITRAEPPAAVGVKRVAAVVLGGEGPAGRVGVLDHCALDRAVRPQQLDEAPVGPARDHETADRPQRLREVQGIRQRGARLGQDGDAPPRVLDLGDVLDRDHPDALAVGHDHGLAVDDQRPGPVGSVPVELLAGDPRRRRRPAPPAWAGTGRPPSTGRRRWRTARGRCRARRSGRAPGAGRRARPTPRAASGRALLRSAVPCRGV